MHINRLFMWNTAFLIAVGLVVAGGLTGLMDRVGVSRDKIRGATRGVTSATQLQMDLLKYDQAWHLKPDSSQARAAVLRRDFSEVESHVDTKEEQVMVDSAIAKINRYLALVATDTAIARGTNGPAYARSLLMSQASQELDRLVGINIQQMESLRSNIIGAERFAKELGYATLIILVLAGAVLLYVQRKLLFFPILQIRRALLDFSSSPFSPIQAKADGVLELHEIAQIFNAMSVDLIRQKNSQFQFLSSIAHDLRNPLTSIQMACEVLSLQTAPASEDGRHRTSGTEQLPAHEQANAPEEDTNGQMLQIIEREVIMLDRLVGDLLETTAMEAGRLRLTKQHHDLGESIRNAVALFKHQSAIHQIIVDLPAAGLDYEFDALRIDQVLNNLLSNAIKYSPNGGTIEVRAAEDASGVTVTIRDHGIGIPREDLRGVFTPFHRSSVTRDTIPGIGLGLGTAKKIVEAHGGKLWIESTPGESTTVHVHLPIAADDGQ